MSLLAPASSNPVSLALQLWGDAKERAQKRVQRCHLPGQPDLLCTKNLEREYLRTLVELLSPVKQLPGGWLLNHMERFTAAINMPRTDELYGDDVVRVVGRMRIAYETKVTREDFERAATTIAVKTNDLSRKNISRQTKAVIGVDVFQQEPWLDGVLDGFVKENVQLIESLPKRHFDQIEQMVLSQVRGGRRAEELAREIRSKFMAKSKRNKKYATELDRRAALIAQDQVGKLHGQLNRARHEAMGLGRYRWRTSKDERVRGNPAGKHPWAKHNHHRREGKIYRYDKPPEDGNPGEPIRCRCWAEPVFEDVLGKAFGVDMKPQEDIGKKRGQKSRCKYAKARRRLR